ncbi:MAG: hypothetical protein ABFD69_07320 [Candidatus Sumerlaeia bacterium]
MTWMFRRFPWVWQLALACAALALARPAAAADAGADQATTVTTQEFAIEVTPNQARIGSRLELRLRPSNPNFDMHRISAVTAQPDPDAWDKVLDWRLDYSKPDASGAGSWIAVLKPFETGRLTIPDAVVTWKPASGGDPIKARVAGPTIQVQSVIPPAARTLDLTPLRDPIAVARDWSWVWQLAVALLVGAIAAWLGRRWWLRRGRPSGPPEPDLPPGLWALHEIDRRSRLPVCASGPAKAIFTLVSEVVRLYLERRYGISAIDMTTIECMRALQEREPGDDVIRWVQSFLDECDVVKFTRIDPAPDRWGTIWNDARLIVKMTTPADELGEGQPAKAGAPEAAA